MPFIATAAVVAVVASALVAGPSLIACAQGTQDLVACLGQEVARTGLLPSGTEQLAAPASQAPGAGVEATATAGPAITLLRAEPDGSLVIAGTGEPNAQIETYANGELLGTTQAEPSGDWAVVPEAPLPAGGVEITVGEAGSAARGAQSFVVVIDPDREAEPLVVATEPGQASEVLQGLPPLLASQPGATVPAPAPPVEAAEKPEPAFPAEPAPAPAEISAPGEALPAQPDAAVAAAEPTAVPPAPSAAPVPAAAMPPTIDAIEIDGGANFFAGGGAEGATVRLYVDDRHVADTEVARGRWLVEARGALTNPSQRIRVDMLKPGTADVASRAEVNFVVELPPAEPEAALPASGPDAVADPVQVAAPVAEQQAAPPAPLAPAPAAVAALPTAEMVSPPAGEGEVPTLSAVPVGDPEAQRFASGKAIIRSGDNLWSIARRVYGDGLKYTTIYRANEAQIRNPSRIYPGQVFDLPKSAPQ